MSAVHFCSRTGVRIVAPGVSKAVDPEGGHLEVIEDSAGNVVTEAPAPETKPEKGSKGSKADKSPAAAAEKPSTPPPADPGSETKPEKGSK